MLVRALKADGNSTKQADILTALSNIHDWDALGLWGGRTLDINDRSTIAGGTGNCTWVTKLNNNKFDLVQGSRSDLRQDAQRDGCASRDRRSSGELNARRGRAIMAGPSWCLRCATCTLKIPRAVKALGAMNSVLVEVDSDGVALVTLNRPERRNGWTPGLEARFFAVLERLDARPRGTRRRRDRRRQDVLPGHGHRAAGRDRRQAAGARRPPPARASAGGIASPSSLR